MKKFLRQSLLPPNFKARGPNGIPTEFFKILIPGINDSEESIENNSNISSGF